MAQVRWLGSAREDLRQIRQYIAQDSPSAAAAMVRRLRGEAARLDRFPERGRVVPEYADPAIRELIVAPYRVMYRYQPERNRVQIIAVVHGSRLLPPLSERT
jgi:toxin ParE1/3/4